MGYVVNCQCGEKDCNKKFHITCAQERHQLLMTDNSALAIESDRSTEFKVLCSAEQVKKMKERNQLESEKLKRKREKAEEEKRKYKDKVPIMDQEKKAKLEKLKKLQKINQQHSNHNQVHPNSQVSSHHKLPSVGNQSKVKREPKMPLTGQKRKTEKKKEILNQKSNNDFTKMAKKKPKMIKEEVNNTSDDIERVRDAAYRLYDSFEKESQQEASYDGGFMAFETMVDLLKDQEMDRLIEPCRRLWAFRQKKQELQRNYKIMKNQRQLMEKQIQIQNSVLNNLTESMKRTDSGYTDRESPDIDPKLESEEPISPTSTLTSNHSVPLTGATTTTSTSKQEHM